MTMRLIVLVGLPGCGKSTYLQRLGVTALSSDEIRLLLTDDATDQTVNDRVFETLRYLLRQRLSLNRPVTYVDATSLTPEERAPYIGIGKSYGCQVEAHFFAIPLEVCMARNLQRHRVVPEEAMKRLALKLQPPSIDEGFTRVVVITDEVGEGL